MRVYCVSFHEINGNADADMIYGVYSSFEKARQTIDYYVKQYGHTIINIGGVASTVYRYDTNEGSYFIEAFELDTTVRV